MLPRRLLETIAGRSFPEIIADVICKPLELEHTGVSESQAELSHLIPGYSRSLTENGLPKVDVRFRYDPAWIATGVVASTAKEIVRFYQGLFTGALLPPIMPGKMCQLRRTVAAHPRYVTPSYGLGLMADPDYPFEAMYGHNGAEPGYSASASYFKPARDDTSKDVTVAVLSNTENADQTESLMLMLAASLTGDQAQ